MTNLCQLTHGYSFKRQIGTFKLKLSLNPGTFLHIVFFVCYMLCICRAPVKLCACLVCFYVRIIP